MPLKGIPNIISPDLMRVLMEMGHGDEVFFIDFAKINSHLTFGCFDVYFFFFFLHFYFYCSLFAFSLFYVCQNFLINVCFFKKDCHF